MVLIGREKQETKTMRDQNRKYGPLFWMVDLKLLLGYGSLKLGRKFICIYPKLSVIKLMLRVHRLSETHPCVIQSSLDIVIGTFSLRFAFKLDNQQ